MGDPDGPGPPASPAGGGGLSEELLVSVKDQLVRILSYGATEVTSVERFLHGDERRALRQVIATYPELFEVFIRGFPESGRKGRWVRLKRSSE